MKLEAGKEQAVAATKTYVNSLGAIALIFATTTGDAQALAELERVPEQIQAQIERSWDDVAALDTLGPVDGGTVVARGINYCTSYEVALKIRELSGLLFEAYSAADLMHGPVAAIGPGWPVFALAPSGPALEAMEAAVADVARRGARVIVVSDVAACARPRRGRSAARRRCAGMAEPARRRRPRPARGASSRSAAWSGSRQPGRALEDHAHPLSISLPAAASGTCAARRPGRRRPSRARPRALRSRSRCGDGTPSRRGSAS